MGPIFNVEAARVPQRWQSQSIGVKSFASFASFSAPFALSFWGLRPLLHRQFLVKHAEFDLV
jgi:hypothetical protein